MGGDGVVVRWIWVWVKESVRSSVRHVAVGPAGAQAGGRPTWWCSGGRGLRGRVMG